VNDENTNSTLRIEDSPAACCRDLNMKELIDVPE